MAHVLVVIELHEGRALPVSLEALGQARRLATELGATVYALVALHRAPEYGEDDLIAQLAAHGADKVLIAPRGDRGDGDDLRWGTHGAALERVCAELQPVLTLFGATRAAREVAARTAALLGAAYLPQAAVAPAGGALTLWQEGKGGARAFGGDAGDPVVATLPPGRYAVAHGDDEAEVAVLPVAAPGRDFVELGWAPDAAAPVLVLAPPAEHEAGAALAAALGGHLANGVDSAAAVASDEGATALAISLGPACPAADARVRLGGAGADADYCVDGAPGALARALAAAADG